MAQEGQVATGAPRARSVQLGQTAWAWIGVSPFFLFALLLWGLAAGYFPSAHPGQSAAFYWVAGTMATLAFFMGLVLFTFI